MLVLVAHGVFPGFLPDAPSAYLAEGVIRCLHDMGPAAVTTNCHAFGEPLGYPLLTGAPVLVLGTLAMHLPGVESHGAYLLALAAFDALALLGGYGLMRRLGAARLVALGTATVYLLSPTVIGMRPFGGTFVGFALLPAYAWCDLVAADAVTRKRGWWLTCALVGYAVIRTGSLFLDGYSFVASALVGGFLWLGWLAQRRSITWRRALGAGVFVLANVVAVALYTGYAPADHAANPIGVIRSMGLDVVTLVTPSPVIWPADVLGVATAHSGLWGDGANATYNYVGLVCAALALAYVAIRPRRRDAMMLAAAGVVALLLSFGPSLKIDEQRPVSTTSSAGQPSFQDYLMPDGAAAADFPWDGLFTAVPGAESMRASYRWFGVTRLVLIVLAGLLVARLATAPGGRRWAAIGLAVLATVEIAPNLDRYSSAHERDSDEVDIVRAEVEPALRDATQAGERAFVLSWDGSHNDYMVNFLAAGAGLRAYNAGGDKNAALSQRAWPVEILALRERPISPDAVAAALASGAADVVIAPLFHPRWSAYSWPPPADMRAEAEAAFASLFEDRRLRFERHEWFVTARLR